MKTPQMMRIGGKEPTPIEHATFNYNWRQWREEDSPLGKWYEKCREFFAERRPK